MFQGVEQFTRAQILKEASFRTCPPSEKKAEVHRARKMMGMAGAASLACSKSINFHSVLGDE